MRSGQIWNQTLERLETLVGSGSNSTPGPSDQYSEVVRARYAREIMARGKALSTDEALQFVESELKNAAVRLRKKAGSER